MHFKQTAFYPYIIFVLVLSISPTLLYADISTDGTVGAAKTLTGPDYTIPETLGTLKGDNLFHSFEKFSIKTQESATFTGSDSIKNVISRVTGGEKSEIDGTLRSNVGKADFYFINPSGVVFGENAKVDVPAAFHVSTANELKFKDGTSFEASKSKQSTLTQAAPESFGFLGTQSTSIEINGSTLEFKPESKVSLTSSKDITIKGTEKETTTESETKQASLTSVGGEIELKAEGDLMLDNATVESSGNGGGKITVKADSVKLQNNSKIYADNTGNKNSEGGIAVEVDKKIELVNGSAISIATFSKGYAGDIRINSENMKIDGKSSSKFTGISNYVETGSSGKAGTVEITVAEYLELVNRGIIKSDTFSKGDAGDVKINAGNVKIDGQGSYAAILNNSSQGSEGNAGKLEISVDGLLEISDGGQICSITVSKNGNAGNISINAEEMIIDGNNDFTGIMGQSRENSKGKAGEVNIAVADNLQLENNATIASRNSSNGTEGTSGKVYVTVGNTLKILKDSEITSSTWSKGDAGGVSIKAGELIIDGQGGEEFVGITSQARKGSEGNPGPVEVNVDGTIKLIDGATISSDTESKADAGEVTVNAANLIIDNKDQGITDKRFTGIKSWAFLGSTGNSGIVRVTVKDLIELFHGAAISSSTHSIGNGSTVIVKAGNMKIDAQDFTVQLTGVACQAEAGSTGGKGGDVIIIVDDVLEMVNGAQISSSTFSKGDAGIVNIKAGKLIIDSGYATKLFTGISSAAYRYSEGNAGSVNVTSESIYINGWGSDIRSDAYESSKGNAGEVKVTVSGKIELIDGAAISSSTSSKGNAGNVIVKAGDIRIESNGYVKTGIESDARTYSQGNAGRVEVTVDGLLELISKGKISGSGTVHGSRISSSTSGKGKADNVVIKADNIRIDGNGYDGTGIASMAFYFSDGNGGTVNITVDKLLKLLNGGIITSSTYAKGDAGSVIVNAGDIEIHGMDGQKSEYPTGIISRAESYSSGYAGKVDINSDSIALLNGGEISIASLQNLSQDKLSNLANLPEESKPSINMIAKQLTIESESKITSESTKNVPASDIKINSDAIYLKDGLITTSVLGTNGDGGNISINEKIDSDDFLVMQNGYIQANTSAEGSKGGKIRVDVENLIADSSMDFKIGGKSETFSLDDKKNIIQAADPSKNPQDIETPEFAVDLGNALAFSNAITFEPLKMAENYCRFIGNRASSLTFEPREWFTPAVSHYSSIYFDGYRLDELLK
ncbi:MAG: filamentous hemagglutinin N-terminal domain-containing protein [Desulfamplus sp.]|nr:filamentous hemagglutinin N-terminal domain-containing protein [Desulfamplus sp.]